MKKNNMIGLGILAVAGAIYFYNKNKENETASSSGSGSFSNNPSNIPESNIPENVTTTNNNYTTKTIYITEKDLNKVLYDRSGGKSTSDNYSNLPPDMVNTYPNSKDVKKVLNSLKNGIIPKVIAPPSATPQQKLMAEIRNVITSGARGDYTWQPKSKINTSTTNTNNSTTTTISSYSKVDKFLGGILPGGPKPFWSK